MDIGHTTRSLLKLKDNGFIMQEVNPNDRRAHILKLTEVGASAFKTSQDLFGQWDKEVMVDFSPEERDELMSLLCRLSVTKGGFIK